MLATFCSTLAGLLVTSAYQKINLLRKEIFIVLFIVLISLAAIFTLITGLSKELLETSSLLAANIILFSVIVFFLSYGLYKKVNIYDEFIEGAKEAFNVILLILPYLIAILVAVAFFRASGAMEVLIDSISYILGLTGIDTEFVKSLPTAMMKPLSGGSARGMMLDSFNTYGVDSFPGRLSSVMQGATDTTFYIIAVYFGSVNIKKTRHAITCGLAADFTGIIAAILLSYLFFT